jgi:hypothetical protein
MILFAVALISLLLVADPAHAGFLAPWLAPTIGGWLGITTASTALAVTRLGLGVAGTLVSRALASKQKGGAQGPGALSLDAPTSGDGTPQVIILGKRSTAGHRTCPEYSRGEGLEWLTIIRDLSDMPVNRLTAIWLGNERITLPDVISGWYEFEDKFAGKARLRFFDGRQTEASSHLITHYGDHPDRPWQADMVLSGVAYVIVELKRDADLFPGIPDLLFEIEGARLPDPRTGEIVYSDNLAHLAWNVMRGIEMPDGTIYGGGIPEADLPLASWASAISEAAAEGWRGGLEVNVGPEDYDGDAPYAIVEHLLQGCAGQVAESGGIWRVRIGGPGLPVATITDRDMLVSEGQVFQPHLGPREVFNGMTAQYSEPWERWEGKTTPLRSDPAYVLRDGARNVTHLTYHAVIGSTQVQKLLKMALDDNRRQRITELSIPLDYDPVEVLDTLRMSLPYDGYVNKLVEVQSKINDPVTMAQRVLVREVDPNDFTPPSVTPLPTIPVVTTRPAPQVLPGWRVEPVIIPDDEGRPRKPAVRIHWDPLPAEGIEWELRSVGDTELAGDGTTQEVEKGRKLITSGVINTARMEIRARAVMRTRARRWTDWTPFTVSEAGITWADWEADLRDQILADLATARQAALDIIAAAEEAAQIRLDLDAAADELREAITAARGELGEAIDAAEQLAMDNLDIARAYTVTEVGLEEVARSTADLALAARILTLTAVLNSDNFLVNPQFMDGLAGWSAFVAMATSVVDRDPASPDPVVATAPTAQFLRIQGSPVQRNIRQDVEITFGENDTFQWRLRASASIATPALVRLQWLTAAGGNIGTPAVTSIDLQAGLWRVFSGQHVPPAGAARLRFELRVDAGATTGTVNFADLEVTRVDLSVQASITDLQVAIATADAATTLWRTEAISRFGNNEAAISEEALTRAGADSAIAGTVTEVRAIANAKNRTYRQPEPPVGPGLVTGDIWYDSNDNNLAYRWNGTGWAETSDPRIAGNVADITEERLVRAAADSSLAGRITSIDAFYGLGLKTGNLILNGSVDTGDFTGWTTVSPELAVVARNPNATGNAVRTSPTAFMIEAPADGATRWARALSNVNVEPGERFLIKARVAGGGVTIDLTWRLQLRFLDITGALVGAFNRDIRVQSNLWQTSLFAPIVVPANAVTLEFLRVERMSGGTGVGYITDVRLEREGGFEAISAAQILEEQTVRADETSAIAQNVTTITATVARKTRTFRRNSEPANPSNGIDLVEGDLWFHTGENNQAYRWTGSAWALTADTRVAAIQSTVTTQGTALATLEGGAAAGYLIRTQAGNSVALFDMVAADGSGRTPASIIKMAADTIILEGSVGMQHLVVSDGSSNMFPDSAFLRQSFAGWVGNGVSSVDMMPREVSSIASPTMRDNAPALTCLLFQDHRGGGNRDIRGTRFKVAAGERFQLSFDYAVYSFGYHRLSLRLRCFDRTGAVFAYPSITEESAPMTWRTVSGEITIPAGAVAAEIQVISWDDTAMTGWSVATNFSVVRKMTGATLITPDGITAELISAATMRALNGQFSSLEAANVRLGTAEIDTLNVAGNAITVPSVGSAGAEVRLTGTSESGLVSTSLNRQGAPTLIQITCQIAGYIDQAIASFRLFRNGVQIANWPGTSAIDGTQTSVAFSHFDENLGTGATTYQLRAARFTSGIYTGEPAIGERTISALHVKR